MFSDKHILSLFFFLFSFSHFLHSQCGTCAPDPVCLAAKPKGVCDSILPDGMVNAAYQHDVSFFMEAHVNDAATLQQCMCNYVQLDSIKFQGASNLPPGMSVEFNKPGKKYYPSKGDTTGCVRFCGTPLVPGNYVVKLNFLADVIVKGITVVGDLVVRDQQQFYTVYINVMPDTSGNVSSFTFGGGSRTTCDSSLTFDFEAVLAAQSPNLTTYSWSFGDGTTSSVQKPGIKTYSNADTFDVSLHTRFLNYRIKTVYVDVKGGYAGDIEEATTIQNPDPYIKFNQLGFANRGSKSDTKKTSWTNLNLTIPEGTDSLNIEVWDEDTGPPQGTSIIGSPDDVLLNTKIKVSLDTARFGNGNVSGFVTFDTILANSMAETLQVIIHPFTPVPSVSNVGDTFCLGQYTPLKVSGYNGYSFQWFNDTLPMSQGNDSIYQAYYTGNYSVSVTNLKTGCSKHSASKTLKFVPSPPDSLIIVVLADGRIVNNNFPNSNYGIRWFKNGQPIQGLTIDDFVFYPDGAGFYSCEVWHKEFKACKTSSPLFLFTSLDELEIDEAKVFPNPFYNEIHIELSGSNHQASILDLNGRELMRTEFSSKTVLHTDKLTSGIYLLNIRTDKGFLTRKIIK
jgi:hypothetical protein